MTLFHVSVSAGHWTSNGWVVWPTRVLSDQSPPDVGSGIGGIGSSAVVTAQSSVPMMVVIWTPYYAYTIPPPSKHAWRVSGSVRGSPANQRARGMDNWGGEPATAPPLPPTPYTTVTTTQAHPTRRTTHQGQTIHSCNDLKGW
ncbi:hypothetical protein PAAG_05429 [Paracoccidioides lutzii Pb01]|uniref:Uncharacterized protein n=1 Tax=Paracoccidioides lutzii (strain ATCC MYA-826 / Pb01) TaxID=502779 RepID=C1H3T6_PARBA|nr:hypothetical protein PAAG_05429 [Paracoccidioides lutzii Pb01]EEH34380.2 hypothetical protein PAAG_05429 [Paracoccidioides lutzii Pb01]